MTTDCKTRAICIWIQKIGGQIAAAEAARNIIAKRWQSPLAINDRLNYGSPDKTRSFGNYRLQLMELLLRVKR